MSCIHCHNLEQWEIKLKPVQEALTQKDKFKPQHVHVLASALCMLKTQELNNTEGVGFQNNDFNAIFFTLRLMREHILVGYLQKILDEVTSWFKKQLNFLVLWYGVSGMYTKGSCCTKSLHFKHTHTHTHKTSW